VASHIIHIYNHLQISERMHLHLSSLMLLVSLQAVYSIPGDIQMVGADFFDQGKHFAFCSFVNANGKMVALDNIDRAHCLSGSSVDIDMQVTPSASIEKGMGFGNEPFELNHYTVTKVNSVNGIPIPVALNLGSPEEVLKKQFDDMVSASVTADGRRLAAASGNSKLLVVRVKLTDDSTVDQYCDETCAANNAWGASSVKVSYQQSSYGQLNLDETQGVVKTVSLSTSISSYGNCNFNQLGSDALAQLTAEGFSSNNFDVITFYMPQNIPGCNFGGVAYVGGRTSWLRSSSPGVMAHELGHNYGVWHAGTDSNNDDVQDTEYGDYSCVMGSPSALVTMNAVHRMALGWVPSNAVGSFSCASGSCSESFTVYDLQATPSSAVSNGGVTVVQTDRMGRSGNYFISYRAGTGLDGNMGSSFIGKVSLHYYSSGNTEYVQSLSAGQSYQEIVNGINMILVSVDSIGNGAAVVTLSYASDSSCTVVDIAMTDSWGDGWNGNKLYFSTSDSSVFVTLERGSSGTAQVCLPDGVYTPFACGGAWRSEVGWSIPAYGVSGGANKNCKPTYGSFTIANNGSPTANPTQNPSSSPTAVPTVSPTPPPFPPGVCVNVEVRMTDSWGDGWNGNNLFFTDSSFITLPTASSGVETVCLPPGQYAPWCCGGGWPAEVGWSLVIDGVTVLSGGADTACAAQGSVDVFPSSSTFAPTASPTEESTTTPTVAPSKVPTGAPTQAPSQHPTSAPSLAPSRGPSKQPTRVPTQSPTKSPTRQPSSSPTRTPTGVPTRSPTRQPTEAPTKIPSPVPSSAPTRSPTMAPSRSPTLAPSAPPTRQPTSSPTQSPTTVPTSSPTNAPTNEPSLNPTVDPSSSPTSAPTVMASSAPTSDGCTPELRSVLQDQGEMVVLLDQIAASRGVKNVRDSIEDFFDTASDRRLAAVSCTQQVINNQQYIELRLQTLLNYSASTSAKSETSSHIFSNADKTERTGSSTAGEDDDGNEEDALTSVIYIFAAVGGAVVVASILMAVLFVTGHHSNSVGGLLNPTSSSVEYEDVY
jgi:hypothetical protein